MNDKRKMTQVSGESRRCKLARCLTGMLTIAVAATLLAASCSPSRERFDDGTNPLSADSSLLSNSFRSLNDLGAACVKALNDSSADELAALMVTEQEFRTVIFPRTPDSLKAGMPCEQAWMKNAEDAGLAIHRKLDALGNRHLTFLRTYVGDTTGTTHFPGKTTFRNVKIVAQMPEGGQVIEFRFMNVVAMVGGRCKVVAYHK